MSPILIRPVREQLEHDRLIRHLQAKYKKRHEVAVNLGEERTTPVKVSGQTLFPDLVLSDGRKVAGVIEVETGESVNNLEAMAQWVHFAKARVPFHLYVPVPNYDAARRLCEAHQAQVTEIWTYRPAMEGFDLVRMHYDAAAGGGSTARAAGPARAPRPAAAKSKSKAAPKPKSRAATKNGKARPARPKTAAPKASAPKAARNGRAAKASKTSPKAAHTRTRGAKKR